MGRFIVIIVVVAAVALAIYYYQAPQGGTPGAAANASAQEPDYYLAGDAFFAKSNYQQAIETYRKAFAKDPGNRKAPEAYYRVGKCYEELKQPNEALKAYEDFVARYSDDSHVPGAKNRIEFLRGTGAH